MTNLSWQTKLPKALWLILLLALCIRLFGIHKPIYETSGTRQEMTASVARNFYELNLPIYKPTIDFPGPRYELYLEFPMYQYMVASLYKAFGTVDERLARLLNILLGLGIILLGYFLAFNSFGKARPALFTAGVLAFAPFMITYTRTVQPDTLMFFLSLCTLCLAYLWQNSTRNFLWLLMSICAGLSLLSKPQSAFIFLPVAYVLWQKHRLKMLIHWQSWGFLLISTSPLILWLLYSQTQIVDARSTWGETATLAQVLHQEVMFKAKFWKNFAEYMFKTFTPVGVFSLIYLFKAKCKIPGFFHAWLISVILYMVGFAANTEGHKYYYVPLVMVLAFYLGALWGQKNFGFPAKWAAKWPWALGLMIIFGSLCLRSTFFLSEEYRRIMPGQQAIQKHVQSNQLIVSTRRLYYTERQGWIVPLSSDLPKFLEQVEDKRQQGARFLLLSWSKYWSRLPELKQRLSERYHLLEDHQDYQIYALEKQTLEPSSIKPQVQTQS